MSGAVVTITGQLPVRLHGGPGSPGDRPTGGLTAFLVEEMRARPGSFWFAARRPDLRPIYGSTRRRSLDGVEAVEFEVPAHDWRDHTTFCAGALWPIALGFPARTVLRRTQEQAYRRFNARLSAALRPLLKPRDLVWVHDYQPPLIARVLRRLGFTGRIGLLLHAPFPPLDAWRILPGASEFLVDMLDYDLVGLSSEGSRDNYLHCVRRSCAAKVGEDRIVSTGRTQRVRVYPGAIDPESFLPSTQAVAATTSDPLPRLVGGRRAVLSLGRMEHAGGIPERIRAFGAFLRHALRRRGKVSLVEIAALGQAPLSERLQVKRDVELATSRVNSEFGDRGWTPVQVVNRLASAELLCS